ncbi:unnamed protein product, partial [Laminaria digitata]
MGFGHATHSSWLFVVAALALLLSTGGSSSSRCEHARGVRSPLPAFARWSRLPSPQTTSYSFSSSSFCSSSQARNYYYSNRWVTAMPKARAKPTAKPTVKRSSC